MRDSFEGLCKKIDYNFNNLDYLEEALTHSSSEERNKDNDRLEFLGDRVLGLIISEKLFIEFPLAETGELAQRYNELVRSESLLKVANLISIGSYIFMSKSEENAGGRSKCAILSDSCEALIGAIFLDGGITSAKRFINKYWENMINADKVLKKDSKTALQEWSHANLKIEPTYEDISKVGPPHKPIFRIKVSLPGYEPSFGEGESKRKAQQVAAANLLEFVQKL
tara:strand:- start:592 stop:1266 length:675 start_codon:yes stop_codon:yes gene_type:complete